MKLVFSDPTFSLQLLRAISETYYKGADIGECLSTAYRIREGDFESWHAEWLKTAKRVHIYADECSSKGHLTSAREAYLRASNYYRVSEFLLVDPKDPRIQTTWGNSKECFSKASRLFPFLVEPIEIPYEEGLPCQAIFTIILTVIWNTTAVVMGEEAVEGMAVITTATPSTTMERKRRRQQYKNPLQH
jgi:hypothetical protein